MQKIFLLLSVFILLSCAKKIEPVDFSLLDTDQIINDIEVYQDSVKSLRGMARVRAKSSFEDVTISQATLLDAPDRFRLEALAVFGQSIAVLVSNGEKVIFKTRNDQIKFEDATSFNLSYFYPGIPSDVKSSQLMDILFGRVPFGLWESGGEYEIGNNDNMLTISYINIKGRPAVLYVDPISLRLASAEIELDGGELLIITYSNYINQNDINFPRDIHLSYAKDELSIKYEKGLELNGKIDESLFFQ